MRIQISLLTLILASCARFTMEPLITEPLVANAGSCHLDIFLEGTKTPEEITEICRVDSSDPDVPWDRSDPNYVVERGWELACQCGAEGVIVKDFTGTYMAMHGFKYRKGIDSSLKKKGIDRQTLINIMNCRYKLGTWANQKCTVRPEKVGRSRPNPRR